MRQARSISSCVASGRPTSRLSRIVRLNSMLSWNTTPMFRRRLSRVMSRRSWPSMRDAPADRVPQPLQQRHGGGLAGAGLADQRQGAARRGAEGDVGQDARRRRDRRRRHPRRRPRPGTRPSAMRARLLRHAGLGIQHLEELGDGRAPGRPGGRRRRRRPSSLPISRVAKPMKLTISPTVALPSQVQQVPSMKIEMMVMVLAARVSTETTRPPVQHRELVVQHLADDVAEHPRLAVQPGEGLHDHDVGQRILRIAGELGLEASRPGPAPSRSCWMTKAVSDREDAPPARPAAGRAASSSPGSAAAARWRR